MEGNGRVPRGAQGGLGERHRLPLIESCEKREKKVTYSEEVICVKKEELCEKDGTDSGEKDLRCLQQVMWRILRQ